jgi:hypothetical protein
VRLSSCLGGDCPRHLGEKTPWVTGKPSGMHGYTQIYVYAYILLGILKFARLSLNNTFMHGKYEKCSVAINMINLFFGVC